jgi:hypothetical protein
LSERQRSNHIWRLGLFHFYSETDIPRSVVSLFV